MGDEEANRGRNSHLIVPEDRRLVAESPDLPPPIWEDADGFPSDEQLEEYVRTLADLPVPGADGIPWSLDWGWARPDLIRYNRVEGPAVGGRFDAENRPLYRGNRAITPDAVSAVSFRWTTAPPMSEGARL